eukprot:2619516-Amphidinium_carterae.3
MMRCMKLQLITLACGCKLDTHTHEQWKTGRSAEGEQTERMRAAMTDIVCIGSQTSGDSSYVRRIR